MESHAGPTGAIGPSSLSQSTPVRSLSNPRCPVPTSAPSSGDRSESLERGKCGDASPGIERVPELRKGCLDPRKPRDEVRDGDQPHVPDAKDLPLELRLAARE